MWLPIMNIINNFRENILKLPKLDFSSGSSILTDRKSIHL